MKISLILDRIYAVSPAADLPKSGEKRFFFVPGGGSSKTEDSTQSSPSHSSPISDEALIGIVVGGFCFLLCFFGVLKWRGRCCCRLRREVEEIIPTAAVLESSAQPSITGSFRAHSRASWTGPDDVATPQDSAAPATAGLVFARSC